MGLHLVWRRVWRLCFRASPLHCCANKDQDEDTAQDVRAFKADRRRGGVVSTGLPITGLPLPMVPVQFFAFRTAKETLIVRA